MRTSRLAATALAALLTITIGHAVPAWASDDGIDALDLEAGDAVVRLGQPTRMWECWENLAGGKPRLYQRINGRLTLLDVATLSTDTRRCSRDMPIKAVYEFTITDPGRWNAAKGYFEADVVTKCSMCVTYRWKIPVKR